MPHSQADSLELKHAMVVVYKTNQGRVGH